MFIVLGTDNFDIRAKPKYVTKMVLDEQTNKTVPTNVRDGWISTRFSIDSQNKVTEVEGGKQSWTKGKKTNGYFTLAIGNKFLTAVSDDQLMLEGMI